VGPVASSLNYNYDLMTYFLVLFSSLLILYRDLKSVLLELDVSKGAGPDGIPPLTLKNCASAFARPLHLLLLRSLPTCVFADQSRMAGATT
jgi:hypothetical protein